MYLKLSVSLGVLFSIFYMASSIEFYKTVFDDLNVDVFADDNNVLATALIKEIMECYMEISPCTDPIATSKGDFREAFRTACERCTPHQKAIAKIFLEKFRNNYAEKYFQFWMKYDPEKKYKAKLLASLNVNE